MRSSTQVPGQSVAGLNGTCVTTSSDIEPEESMMKRMFGRSFETALPVPTKISLSSAIAAQPIAASAAAAVKWRKRMVVCFMAVLTG